MIRKNQNAFFSLFGCKVRFCGIKMLAFDIQLSDLEIM